MADETKNDAATGDTGDTKTAPTETGSEKTERTVPYARFQQVNEQKKAAEETLQGVVEELVQDIPEDFRDLVPQTAPADQIRWIRGAMKKGLFDQGPKDGPDTKRPGGKPPVNLDAMTPAQMREAGYKSR